MLASISCDWDVGRRRPRYGEAEPVHPGDWIVREYEEDRRRKEETV
jgi:hypothetical protein